MNGCNKNKIIIGLDVDNTFNNFSELFVLYFNRLTGKNMKVGDINDWDLKKVINHLYKGEVDGNIAKEIYEREDFVMGLELVEGTRAVLEEISKDERVILKLVTAMSKKELTSVRDKWIEGKLNNLNIEVVYETNKENVKMDYLIDDAPHNLDSVSKIIGEDNCICIEHEYNKHVNYKKVNTLKEAFNYIYKKENLI